MMMLPQERHLAAPTSAWAMLSRPAAFLGTSRVVDPPALLNNAQHWLTQTLLSFYSLIALSFKPFVVVHVNGPFTDLTGQSSIGTLGKPLHDMFVQDPLVTAALQTSCQQFTLASLDGQAIKMIPSPRSSDSLSDASRSTGSGDSPRSSSSQRERQNSASICTVRVRPIGQDGESGRITHYLLEVVQVGDKVLVEDEVTNSGEERAIKRTESAPSSCPIQVTA
jgi:hypothetical protein